MKDRIFERPNDDAGTKDETPVLYVEIEYVANDCYDLTIEAGHTRLSDHVTQQFAGLLTQVLANRLPVEWTY